MGTIHFLLPSEMTAEAARELERSCLTGSPDNMPWPTTVQSEPGRLTLQRRNLDESGCLVAPWPVPGAGLLMGTSATLMERSAPYHLPLELSRGKVNQVRCQTWDWTSIGLHVPEELARLIRDASTAFGQAVTGSASGEADGQAEAALALGYRAADRLVHHYVEQLLQVRHQRQPHFDTTLSCSLGPAVPDGAAAAALAESCNAVRLPFAWNLIEPAQGSYQWEASDALLDWARARELSVSGGPLIDFSASRLPEWLWLWEHDTASLTQFLCGYVETVVKRYREHIRRWQLTAASNNAAVLTLNEEELLYLTLKVVETARRIDPELDLTVGIAQPWGEYLAQREHTRSPFLFADELARTGMRLAGLDLEVVLGIAPRGSYCRDLLEVSRLLDLYALLGLPLGVTLGYPSAKNHDPLADPELRVAAGHWHDGFSPAVQADWAAHFGELVVAKPYVSSVTWAHLIDAEPHQFPHCGLVDAEGQAKPVVRALRTLREKHLFSP
jgi:hypothetical protein